MITVTDRAASKVKEIAEAEALTEQGLRLRVVGGGCAGFTYDLYFEDQTTEMDELFESNGVKLFVDPISIRYLNGAEVDFVDTVTGGGFTIKNPNATSTCGCGQSFSV